LNIYKLVIIVRNRIVSISMNDESAIVECEMFFKCPTDINCRGKPKEKVDRQLTRPYKWQTDCGDGCAGQPYCRPPKLVEKDE
jgi:hypothetical protein